MSRESHIEGHPFRLRLLGTPELTSARGDDAGISAGKPLALLAFVALAPEPPSRDTLATLLWPGSPRRRARGSLRQALWQLRRTLGEDAFVGDDPVELLDGRLTTDIHRFREHLDEDRLRDALGLWRGPPLQDLHVPDAPEWQRWADDLRRDLERRLGSALAARGRADAAADMDEDAVHWLRMAREVQPDHLRHHLDLVEAHLDRRAFDDAAEALARARRRFDDPAALEPVAELEERLEALQRGTAGGAAGRPPTLLLTFTGRAEEYSTLARGWRQAREGASHVAFVTGEAGIGKTRLAEEVCLLARSEGGRVIQAKAEDMERPIEWALVGELVDQLLHLSGAAGISSGSTDVLRTVVPSLPHAGSGEGHVVRGARPSAALADALQDLMTAVAEDAPLLVFIDDLQWADAESRALLARVATRPTDAPVFFLVTSRTGPGDVAPRMRKTLQLLDDAAGSMALALRPFSSEEIRSLLRETLRIPARPGPAEDPAHNDTDGPTPGPTHTDPERLIERIVRTCRGNPLFVVELLKVLRDEGIVSEDDDGGWRLRPERVPPDLPLPASLRELIDRQLAHLPEHASLVAAHLAHAGRPVPSRILASQAGLRPEALTEGVGELVHRRMVRWEAGEKLAFAHDELRAAVARRFQLHVGLTTGGGTQWSLFRSAVVASLVLLLASAAAYVYSEGTLPSAPPLGGGPLVILHGPDSLIEARAPATSAGTGWRVGAWPARAAPPELPSFERARGAERALLASPADTRFLDIVPTPQGGDSARILRPDGSLVDTARWQRIHGVSWCGGTPPALLLTVLDGGEARLVRWNPDADEVREIEARGLPGAVLACSPDGAYGAALTADAGEMALQVMDMADGEVFTVPVDSPHEITGLHWAAELPTPVPTAVRLTGPAQRTLDWGESLRLEARVENSDGSSSTTGLTWHSRDPGVASVTPDGVITANRPGTTMVEVSFDGWLADSLRLRVAETDDTPRVLLWDRVPPLGDDIWRSRPPASRSTVEGLPEWARGAGPLEAADAWYSRDGFTLPAGGTLEADFTLAAPGDPLHICLVREAAGSASEDAGAAWDAALCLTLRDADDHPDDAQLYFHPAFPPLHVAIPPSGTGRRGRWHHLGLAVLPDGTGAMSLDGEEVARTPARLPLQSEEDARRRERWHVLLEGIPPIVGGTPTRRGFRNVLLWPEVRF